MAKQKAWADEADRLQKNSEHLEHMEAGESKPVKVLKGIVLPKLDIRQAELTLVGDSELIVHNWSAKAIRMMLDNQMGEATAGREPKNPVEDFLGSLYTIEPGKVKGKFNLDDLDPEGHPKVVIEGGQFGLPAIAFKCAAVEACTSNKGAITKTAARQCFHVMGEIVPVIGQPRMRKDMVRLQREKSDVRFRAGFPDWKVTLRIRYNARLLTVEQLMNLFNIAGFGVGVGEWRSERDGSFGSFHVQ